MLIEQHESGASALNQVTGINTIVDCIQQGMQSNHSIVCANFLSKDDTIRVIASTRYCKLSEEAVVLLQEEVMGADGKSVIVDGRSVFFTHRVTRDIRHFIQHIRRIPGENFTELPFTKESISGIETFMHSR